MISVVIPLYNKAHTITRSLTSVMRQEFTDFEVIVIDDGSTDNGRDIILSNFQDSRIKVIPQQNAGVSAARNRGVTESHGDYIAFLDADDEWHPQYLSYIVRAISRYPDTGIICSAGMITYEGSDIREFVIAPRHIGKISKLCFFENPAIYSHTSRTVVKKSVFYAVGGFIDTLSCCEDLCLTQMIALQSPFIYIGIPLSKYVGGVEGQITSADSEKRYRLLASVVIYYNQIYACSHNSQYKRLCHRYLRYDIRHRFKGFLLHKDNRSMQYFHTHLDDGIKSLFFRWELYLYRTMSRHIGIFWVNISKLIWRVHCYPVIGAKFNINLIPPKFRNW